MDLTNTNRTATMQIEKSIDLFFGASHGEKSPQEHKMENSRQETINAIFQFRIPKIGLAALANVSSGRISDYMRGRSLSADKVSRIEDAVLQVVKVWTCLPVKTDIADPESFARAIQIADAAIAKEQFDSASAEATTAISEFARVHS